MSWSRSLAHVLMRLATRRPPPNRTEWAVAMQREFDTLESGELGWALGCFTTMIGWQLREEWLYLALLCLTPILVHYLDSLPFDLLWWNIISRETFVSFIRPWGAVTSMLSPLPIAIILGAYRPNRIRTTILFGCLLGQHVIRTLLTAHSLGGSFFSWWDPVHATLYMAPPLVGLCASVGVWYLGASAGALWVRRGPGRWNPHASNA